MAPLSAPLTLAAFILLLLVTLSTPIIKPIYLFRLSASVSSSLFKSGASAFVNFGVWGYCTSPIDVSILGTNHQTFQAQCSHIHIGYTFDSNVAAALDATDIENIISRTATAALVIHPLVASLAFLTFLASLFTLSPRSSNMSFLLTFWIGLLAAGLTTLIFLIDAILVAVIRKAVRDVSHGDIDLSFGNAIWMSLGAAIALWLSVGLSLREKRRKTFTYYTY